MTTLYHVSHADWKWSLVSVARSSRSLRGTSSLSRGLNRPVSVDEFHSLQSSPLRRWPGWTSARPCAREESRGIKSSSRYHQVTSHEIKAREHSQPRLGQARILYHRPLRSPCFLQNPRIRVTLSWKWGSRQWATVGLDNLSDLTLPAQGCAASRRLMIAVLFHDESFTPKSIIPRCDVGG